MDRLTSTLLASLGGGILLGTGLKLGEALTPGGPGNQSSSSARATQRVLRRIRDIEGRLDQTEFGTAGRGEGSRAGHLRKLQAQVALLEREIDALERTPAAPSARDRGSSAGRDPFSNTDPIADRGPSERRPSEPRPSEPRPSDKPYVNSAAETTEARVIDRIAKLEQETASQSAALRELQATAAKTEKSVQRLIAGLDRLLSSQPFSSQFTGQSGE